MNAHTDVDVVAIALRCMAGLTILLLGVASVALALKGAARDRVERVLRRATENRWLGFVVGVAATAILDSSSVTIILVIALVRAGVLPFTNALAVVLGANVGTTIGAQIIALDVDRWSPVLLTAGALVFALSHVQPRAETAGRLLMSVGAILFGLSLVDEAAAPLAAVPGVQARIAALGTNPLHGAFVGAVVTALLQSSSATVALVVSLAQQGLVPLHAGVALVLGAEVGTCADTLVASLGRSRTGFRVGMFHLVFNVVAVALGLVLLPSLLQLTLWVSGDDVGRQIANAQLLFNAIGALACLSVLPWVARALAFVVPGARRATTAAAVPV